MDPVRWNRVKDLFELGEPLTSAEREALLAQEPDALVRHEAARLLSAIPQQAFIDQPVVSHEFLDRIAGPVTVLSPGEMLGERYRIEDRIGSGGMGEVYSAYDMQLRERVAIKTLRPEIMADPAMVSRFRREITLARRVSHPNVCRVFDLSSEARSSDQHRVDFLTMELVGDTTLSTVLKQQAPMTLDAARPLLEQICAGLAAAHDAGVVHRDFKGSNVLLAQRPDGTTRAAVTDFGLARSVVRPGMSQESSTGLAGGTPAYMSPEQMEGRAVGPKSDLYALGIVMYEMATGAKPHPGDSPLQIAVRRATQPPVAPRIANPHIDPRWEEAILKCLQYKPEDRPADARAVAAMLGRKRAPVFAALSRVPKIPWPWIAAVLSVAALAGWWFTRPPGHNDAAQRWYRKGLDSLLDGSYSNAKTAFEEALKAEPTYGAARARLADTYYELDMPGEARAEAGKAMSGDRNETLLIEGIRLALQRKIPEALERMDKLVARQGDVESLLDRARILDRADRVTDAIAAYQKGLARDPALPWAQLRLAVLLDAVGKKKEAADALAKAEAQYQKFGNAEGRAAVALERAKSQEKLDIAEGMAREARTLAEQAGSATLQVRAIFAQASYAARRGDTARGEALAEEALAVSKSQKQTAAAAAGLRDLAFIAYKKGDLKAAAIGYRDALDVAERDGAPRLVAELRRSLGDTMARDGKVDEGIKLIEQARGYHEANGDVIEALRDRLYLADCEAMAERHDAALRMQKEILAEAVKVPGGDLLARRIRLSLIQGEYTRGEYPDVLAVATDALADYQRSGEKPKEMFVRPYLSGALRHLGRVSEARAALAPALVDPDNPYLPLAIPRNLELLADEGNSHRAIQMAEDAVKKSKNIDPASDEVRYLCFYYAFSDQPAAAEKWCGPLRLITPEASGLIAGLHEATFAIQASKADWSGALTTARKLESWTVAHHDPEFRLLSQILVAAAMAEGGRKPTGQVAALNWKKERASLESRWGPGNVKGVLSLPRFRRYSDVISQIESDSKERNIDGIKARK